MKHRTARSFLSRRHSFTRRLLAPILAVTLVISASPWQALAQETLSCSVGGFCLSGNLTNLLGLPNGTLKIVTYHPWDRILHGPKPGAPLADEWSSAVSAWGPLEAEARATVAAIHGVPNDFRMPHAAASELRAQMLFRLIQIAKSKSDSLTLTGVERDALDAFVNLIVARRVHMAQKALDEYDRWASDPCHYQVPVRPGGQSYGFDQYDPGSICHTQVGGLFGSPRPPTADQFKAYGAAVALEPFINADREAAWREFDQQLALAIGLLSAVVLTGVTAMLAVVSLQVSFAFAAVAGSFSVLGTLSTSISVGATVMGPIVGAGAALALPGIILAAAAILAVSIIQVSEDQSVRPALLELRNGIKAPDVWSMAQNQLTFAELASVLLIPTSPEYTETERAGAEAAKVGPSQRAAGDPRFQIDGTLRDTIFTWNGASRLQETFMSQGWFVTRTRVNDVWGPWQWSLTLEYRPGTLTSPGTRIAGIQPSGFIDMPRNQTTPTAAVRTTQLSILNEVFATTTVTWAGNHAPVLAPTVSQLPTVSTPVTFKANASDSDLGSSIVGIRWFIEDPTFNPSPLPTSTDECTFNPPERIDPVSGLKFVCPWKQVDDSSDVGITYTFARPGTWGIRVLAIDDDDGIGSQQFTVNIGNLAPTLTIAQGGPLFVLPPAVPTVTEGQTTALIGGTVNYPGLGDGSWGALTTLVVDWGDGQITKRAYPCNAADLFEPNADDEAPEGSLVLVESDRHCLLKIGSAAITYADPLSSVPLPVGPWPFNFSHTYTFNPARTIPTPTQVKVYAVTTLDSRTETFRFDLTVSNVPPSFDSAPICPYPDSGVTLCPAQADPRTAPIGSDVYLRGLIWDAPSAQHFVKVLWGDGTSTAYAPGCTTTGCPGHTTPWAINPYDPARPPKFVGFTHQYATPGIYSVKLELDDGGPNGTATYTTTATAFGVTAPSGPTDVRAGEPVAYSYKTGPAGFPADVTPTCTGGTAVNLTPSTGIPSFSCTFADVAGPTAAQVKLHAVVAGHTFDHVLDVTVRPRATTISALLGPTAVTEGTTHTYSYAESHSPLGITSLLPTCGDNATLTEAVNTNGSGTLVCRFNPVSASSQTDVSMTIAAPGGTATSSLAVTITPDTEAPLLTLPTDITTDSTSNAGAVVAFTTTASDAVSGPAAVACTPSSGSLFPIGATAVSCSAADWKGNAAPGTFLVTVIDKTPPTLSLPAPITVDATGPSGALVTYTALATEDPRPGASLSCTPASASIFPIGTTTVGCFAIDLVGNTASDNFAVTVRGAADQIAMLRAYVQGETMDAALKRRLLNALSAAATAITSGRGSACRQMATVASIAEGADKKLTPVQVARILTDVARIRAVLGC